MKATIASIALLLAMVANAGPFGYEMGQKIEGEPDGVASDIGSNYKELQNPPPPFDRVLAFYTDRDRRYGAIQQNQEVRGVIWRRGRDSNPGGC